MRRAFTWRERASIWSFPLHRSIALGYSFVDNSLPQMHSCAPQSNNNSNKIAQTGAQIAIVFLAFGICVILLVTAPFRNPNVQKLHTLPLWIVPLSLSAIKRIVSVLKGSGGAYKEFVTRSFCVCVCVCKEAEWVAFALCFALQASSVDQLPQIGDIAYARVALRSRFPSSH